MEMGKVVDNPVLDAGEYWYRVQFVHRVENIVEEDLDGLTEDYATLERLAQSGRWGTLHAFRCALAVERIQNTNRTTVYTYRAQRILFEPYQYKPLLKVLDSPDRRLLIADEVGLGKTIEAGLILTELEARDHLDKILIVCPSRLRDKWREELNRKFNQDFEIYTSQALRDYIARVSESPERSRLRGIISIQTLRNEDLLDLLEARVGYLNVVVVDEAHHGRNPATQTAELLQALGRIGGTVLFLTATPLQLSTRDLFTLLQSLRPTEFRDPSVFDEMLRSHSRVHRASAIVRSATPEQLPRAADELRAIFAQGDTIEDPLAAGVVGDLLAQAPIDRRAWVELERRIQDLHPLASILTRTRKREVQENAPTRRAAVFRCQWTEEEDRAYQALVAGSTRGGWIGERLTLGQIQRARQAASSIHAAILSGRGSAIVNVDDEASEITDILPSEAAGVGGGEATGRTLPNLPRRDSKFEKLLEVLRAAREEDVNAKVLIFTFFVGTAKYVAERLTKAGYSSLWIAGEVTSDPRHADRDERGRRLRQFAEDNQISVLVSTEVGSEGLDFQFCHHLVNYDLPWNPMVVEQRIGRIDRYGQKSKVVHIHNLVADGTVEDRILLRLYERIGIFRESIGELEIILGDTIRELRRDYISGLLTPQEAERRVEEAAYAINNRRIQFEELQRSVGELFGHEEFIRAEMERVGRLGRYLAEQSILAVLRAYLESHHPGVRIWEDSADAERAHRSGDGVHHPDVRIGEDAARIYGLHLTDALSSDIRLACSPGQVWLHRARDGRLLFTTDGAVAFERNEIELINASHPLLRAAVAAITPRLSHPSALVGQATVDMAPGQEIDEGVYCIVVVAHEVTGIQKRRDLDEIVWSLTEGRFLEPETGERLLHLVMEQGYEWTHLQPAPCLPLEVWNRLLSEARTRNRAIRRQKTQENEALYTRRKAVIEAEDAHARQQIDTRLATARARGRPDSVLALFEAQLQKAESRYRERVSALDADRHIGTRLSDPIAVCVVSVRHRTATGPT
jgi:SNF2 family DNA or RNA helicase